MNSLGSYTAVRCEYKGENSSGKELCASINTMIQLTHEAGLTPGNHASSHVSQLLADVERHVGDRSFCKLVENIRYITKTFSSGECEKERNLGQNWITNNAIRDVAKRDVRFKYRGQNDDVRSLQAITFELNDTINNVRQMSLNLVSNDNEIYQNLERICFSLLERGNSLHEKLSTSGTISTLNPKESRIVRDWKFASPFELSYDPEYPEETKMTEWSEALLNITKELNDLSKSASEWDVGGAFNVAPQDTKDANSQTRTELISLGNSISGKITQRDDLKPSEAQAVTLWQEVSAGGKTY